MARAIGLLFCLIVFGAIVVSYHSPQAPKIPSGEKAHLVAQSGQKPDYQTRQAYYRALREEDRVTHASSNSGGHENECEKGNSEYRVFIGNCLKITDFYLTVFNGLLVGLTALLGFLAFRQETALRRLERCLVYGGPGFNWLPDEKTVRGKIITIGNYGKTAAHIEFVRWEIAPFADWKPGSKPANKMVIRDIIYPMTPPTPKFHIPFPAMNHTLALWGRIYFKDVFGDRRYSTFEHRLEVKEGWASYPLEHNAELHDTDEEA